MKYYTFRQNNPKGRWQPNMPLILSIQAKGIEEAELIGKRITGYNEDYCKCCGGYRWSWSSADFVEDVPTYCDVELTKYTMSHELYGSPTYKADTSYDFWVVDSEGVVRLKVCYERGEVLSLE